MTISVGHEKGVFGNQPDQDSIIEQQDTEGTEPSR